MEEKTKKIIEKINALAASQSVLEHLVLSLFDCMDNKNLIIQRFYDTTETTLKTLNIDTPVGYASEFRVCRDIFVKMLYDVQGLTAPQTYDN